MKPNELAWQFVAQAKHSIAHHHFPRLEQCLKMLSEEDIWWRPNDAANSVGNLVLHLSGNLRQWIIAGLGGAPDRRHRDEEFAERGPLPRRSLLMRLRKTVWEAAEVLDRLDVRELSRERNIQGFNVTGLTAVFHVAEHFALHTGQILYVTKMRLGQDLSFTRLRGQENAKASTRELPAL